MSFALLGHIVVVLLVAGLLLWVAQGFGIPAPFQRMIYAVVVIGVLLWIMQEVGWLSDWDHHDHRRNDYRAPDPSSLLRYAARAPDGRPSASRSS